MYRKFKILFTTSLVMLSFLMFFGISVGAGVAEASVPAHSYDTNQDWSIGDFELLNAIDAWVAGNLGDFELLDLIDFWAAGEYFWDPDLGIYWAEIVAQDDSMSDSFSPVTALDQQGNELELYWKYRINNNSINASQNGISMYMSLGDVELTIDPATLLRKGSFSGTFSGDASGTFDADFTEAIDLSTGKTLINGQEINLSMNLSVEGITAVVDIGMEVNYSNPAEWFLDRNDLDVLPVGYVYDETGTVNGMLTGDISIEFPSYPSENFNEPLSSYVTSPEVWEITGKQDSIIVNGKEYYNIVKVERRTLVPDFNAGSQQMTVTYWVAKGIGMVKGAGQYTFYNEPLSLELVETNLEQ